VGASAGGVEALRFLAAGLPPELDAAVLVVLHVPRDAPSALSRILHRAGPLPAATAVDGAVLLPGRIYVAPADHHLLLLDNRIRLSNGPSENGHRPAVDPLFRSVARAVGPRGVAVVLSGSRDDGSVGAAAMAAMGGTVVVQDPADALVGSMPRATLARVPAAQVAAADKLGDLVAKLVAEPLPESLIGQPGDKLLDDEIAISDLADVTTDRLLSVPAGYGCPSCGGGLFELGNCPTPRYRCRIGHAWSPESLLAEQAVATEGALWMALRALEEKSALSRRMADTGAAHSYAARFARLATDADQAGALIRELIDRLSGTAPPEERAGLDSRTEVA
jgi:two-component system chemotaxis response regulator CheB